MDQEEDGTMPLGRRVFPGGDPNTNANDNNNEDVVLEVDAALALSPFPSLADGLPSSPSLSSPSASSVGDSALPEVSSEFADEAKMNQTNAWFLGHHHAQVVASMHKKFQDILDYAKTKNRKILHIDWVAGNPNDPAKLAGAAAAWSGMTELERRLRETVAKQVMKHTHGIDQEQWDETLTWNKTMFFGDWLNDARGFRQFFMEIQIKRISGDDPTLMEQCGISPNYVWLPMHDEHAPAITALVCPPPGPRPAVVPRQLPVPGQVARAGASSRQEHRQEIAAPAAPSAVPAAPPAPPPVSPPASPPTSSSSSSSGSSSDSYENPAAAHIENSKGKALDTSDSPFNGDEIYEDDDDDEYEDADSDDEDDADQDADGEYDDDYIQGQTQVQSTSDSQTQTTTQDKGKGKAPRVSAAEFAKSLKKRTPLPSLSGFAHRVANWDISSSSSSSAAGPSNPPAPQGISRPVIAPPPGIPRSRPLPLTAADAAAAAARAAPASASGSIPGHAHHRATANNTYNYNNNNNPNRTQTTAAAVNAMPTATPTSLAADNGSETSEDAYHDDESALTYSTRPVNSFDAVIPAHHAPAQSAADMSRHHEDYSRAAYAKRLELDRIFTFLREPTFAARVQKSYIYAVRVVAFPDRGGIVNNFTGPSVDGRQGSIIAMGGWVVPPMEERIKHREDNQSAYGLLKGAAPGTYAGPPKPQVQNAMPAQFDWSAGLEPRYFGPVAPVWREVCEPSLEDIYWMVWQVLAGKQFLGFQPGIGFGRSRLRASGDLELLHQCPFSSPSEEAQYHAASYPRGKETK